MARRPGRIDAHQHFWDPTLGDYPWMRDELAAIRRPFLPSDLGPVLVEAGVDRTVAVQARAASDETHWLLGLADEHAFIGGVVGWIDLTRNDVADQIATLREAPGGKKLVGIRHPVHDEADPDWLRRDDVNRGLATVAGEGLVFDLLLRTRELPAAFSVAQSLPGLRFVVDHLAKPGPNPPEGWTEWIARLAALPNVAAKVSGLVTEAQWETWSPADFEAQIDFALEAFGAERLLYGSDWPVCLLAATYHEVFDLAGLLLSGLDTTSQELVFGDNALSLYGIMPASDS